MHSVTLIIDKRTEISVKYKKLLESEANSVGIARDLISSLKFIQDNEPDLIIISDSMDNDLSDYCKKIRALTYNMRPIIIATSKSAEINDRLKVLDNGADDFISEPVNSKEFATRMKAHLRREFESNLDSKKLLPNRNYSFRALKRVLSKNEPWACLLISIENLKSYAENYTELASDKLLQTFCAIAISTLSSDDYIGTINDGEFLIITNQLKSEKIANYLVNAFDSIIPKFYTKEDYSRGYVITDSDDIAGRRSNFVHLTIGIVTNEFEPYKKTDSVLSALRHVHSMAELHNKSNYLAERIKLSAADSVLKNSYNNSVLIYEKDEATQELLKTVLEIQGLEFVRLRSRNDIKNIKQIPAVMIIDAGDNSSLEGLDLCRNLRKNSAFNNVKIIVTTNIHDKELVLNTGADVYLPKPYELSYLVEVVNNFIKEINLWVLLRILHF